VSDEREVNAQDQIRLTKESSGWSFVLAPKGGGLIFRHSDQAATFDEAVAKIKERYRVD
jgi:hypothetical protein